MKKFWDRRYSEPGFIYGQEPNDFFRETINGSLPGKLLLPGEGEGRNAIHAARKGWDVTAIDQSAVAVNKALEWAGSEGLRLSYQLADLREYRCQDPSFDLVAILFVHLPPSVRKKVHRQLAECVKPGGLLIQECFHKTQLHYNTGGPSVEEMLYAAEDLIRDFNAFNIIQCEHRITEVREGKYHSGKSSVIRSIAKKH